MPNVLLEMGMYLIRAIIFTKVTRKDALLIKHPPSALYFHSNGGAPVENISQFLLKCAIIFV